MRRPLIPIVLMLASGACADPVGTDAVDTSISITVSTRGPVPGQEYAVSVDGVAHVVAQNGSLVVRGLTPGDHAVTLSTASGCDQPAPARVPTGGSIHFDVTCVGTGSVRITTRTTGVPRIRTYSLSVWSEGTETEETEWESYSIGPDRTMEFSLPVGRYTVWLGTAANCVVSTGPAAIVDVRLGEVTDIAFDVSCVDEGVVRTTVSATGGDIPPRVNVRLLGRESSLAKSISAPTNGTTADRVAVGDWIAALGLPDNCSSDGGDPVSLTVAEGQIVDLAFAMTCLPHMGALRVSMTTTGARDPGSFKLNIDGGCPFEWDCWTDYSLPSNGTSSVDLLPGQHSVAISATHCAVSPAVPVVVEVSVGGTTEVAFAASCS